MSYFIRDDGISSNHSVVSQLIQLIDAPSRKNRWHMNLMWVDEIALHMERIWQEFSTKASFFRKIRFVTKFYKQYCKKEKENFRTKEEDT